MQLVKWLDITIDTFWTYVVIFYSWRISYNAFSVPGERFAGNSDPKMTHFVSLKPNELVKDSVKNHWTTRAAKPRLHLPSMGSSMGFCLFW